MSCWFLALALPAVAAAASLSAGSALAVDLPSRRVLTLEADRSVVAAAKATARGFVLMCSGVPVIVGGRVVGAIGVSADTADQDELVAKSGAAVLAR